MSQPAKLQEPSMEEILASIRRIIADDDGVRAAPVPAKPAGPNLPVLGRRRREPAVARDSAGLR